MLRGEREETREKESERDACSSSCDYIHADVLKLYRSQDDGLDGV